MGKTVEKLRKAWHDAGLGTNFVEDSMRQEKKRKHELPKPRR